MSKIPVDYQFLAIADIARAQRKRNPDVSIVSQKLIQRFEFCSYYPYPDDDISYRDSASQKRPEIQKAFANEYSHQHPPEERAPLPPVPPTQNFRQPEYHNRYYNQKLYDNKPVSYGDTNQKSMIQYHKVRFLKARSYKLINRNILYKQNSFKTNS